MLPEVAGDEPQPQGAMRVAVVAEGPPGGPQRGRVRRSHSAWAAASPAGVTPARYCSQKSKLPCIMGESGLSSTARR